MTSRTTPYPDEVVAQRPAASDAPRRPSLATTSSVVFFGHLVWLGWLWLVLLVGLPIALTVIGAAGGELDESLWTSAAAGWQRWVLFACGVITSTSFLKVFVSRGVTRRRLTSSGLVAMSALVVLGQIVVVLGFLIEAWFFDRQGWPQLLSKDGDAFGTATVGRLVLEHAALMAVHFLCGWLVGAGFVRFGTRVGILLIAPCLMPIAAAEVLVSRDTGRMNIDALPDLLDQPHGAVVALGCAAVIAILIAVVTRVTRLLPVR